MDIDPKERDRAIRRQAVGLTEQAFRKISPPPQRSVEKVAPVVYALLIDEVDPRLIEKALIIARAHTPDGISYALRTLAPGHDKTQKPTYREIKPEPYTPPTAEEKAVAKTHIAAARAMLHKS